MTRLSTVEKIRITEVLNSTRYSQHGFSVRYDDEKNPAATITFPGYPDYQFAISATDDGSFTINERPGPHSDESETFQKNSFDLCVTAIKEWAERIIDQQRDWILDEFGGVADRNPSLNINK